MGKSAEYYYEVRAIGYTSNDRKYMKRGNYVTSEDTILLYDGDTSGEWKGNTYIQEDGGTPRNCWKQIQNDWYYFDGNGIRRVGWVKSGQRWYYLSQKEGKLTTGWQFINDKWYYLNTAGGEMMTGWIQPKPMVWYYMYNDGSMAKNTVINGYHLDAAGKYVK
jgi:glucan-binding YG repeat protein